MPRYTVTLTMQPFQVHVDAEDEEEALASAIDAYEPAVEVYEVAPAGGGVEVTEA